jgi:hypothetical protein
VINSTGGNKVARSKKSETVVNMDRNKPKDEIAEALSGVPVAELHKLAKEFLDENTKTKYKHLNAGMQRMNVGNKLRAAARKDTKLYNKLVKAAKKLAA